MQTAKDVRSEKMWQSGSGRGKDLQGRAKRVKVGLFVYESLLLVAHVSKR